MNVEEVLGLAASCGVGVALSLGDLRLEADYKPPVDVVDALRDHKEAVVSVLSKRADEWQRLFEEHVVTVARAQSAQPRGRARRVPDRPRRVPQPQLRGHAV